MLKDAIPLRLGFELVVGNDGLVPPFGYGGQIIQILEKFLVICNRKHNGGLRPGPVGQILQVGTHGKIYDDAGECRCAKDLSGLTIVCNTVS